MKNKNYIKIILDVIMTVLLILMYNKRVISMKFHEVGGLIVLGIFIIHIGLNFKWVTSISKKIFTKKLPMRTRISYIINVLLLLCVTFIGISGILISKTIFTGISSNNLIWKIGHQSVSGLALILVGIHIGLHWNYIKAMFGKVIKIPSNIAKPLGIICMVGILGFGSYSIVTSSFSKWISMPINAISGGMPSSEGGHHDSSEESRSAGQKEVTIENQQNKSSEDSNNSQYKNDKQQRGEGSAERQKPGGQGMPGANEGISIISIIKVITTYLSIAGVFAIITYWVEKFFIKKKSRK